MMTVEELMEILEELEPEAEVLIASQPNWPFEVELAGVVTREECDGADATPSRDGAPTDVFLVEGQQLRYGSKAPFHLAQGRR